LETVSEKTCTLEVKLVTSKNIPKENVNVKVFRIEQETLTLKQWTENLKNGTPFKRLILCVNTDNNGKVTAELPEGVYEVKVEECALSKDCELKHNVEILFVEPKKRWWQQS
jgi:hypothetical protein